MQFKSTLQKKEFNIFLVKLFIAIFYISILFKSFSLVAHAYENLSYVYRLYGDSYNSYTTIDTGGNTIEYLFPYYCLCAVACFSDGNYIVVICPESSLVDNGSVKGVDRRRVYRDSTGKITGGENATFYQMTGYKSSFTFDFENDTYVVRTMSIQDQILIKGLCLSVNSSYVHDATWVIADYLLSGFKAGHLTAQIGDANVTIDTTNIEQLITDSNTIATDTNALVSDIQNEITSESSSQVGFNDSDRTLIKRYDIWLLVIMFLLGFSVFRNMIHQTGRNIRIK